MNRLELAKQVVNSATLAVRLKQRQMAPTLRRATQRLLHLKEFKRTEEELAEVIAPVIREEVKSIVSGLFEMDGKSITSTKSYEDNAHTLVSQVFNAREWHDRLIDKMLPVMAVKMLEAATAEMLSMGVDPRRSKGRLKLDEKWNPAQPRDEFGRWAGGSGGLMGPDIGGGSGGRSGSGMVRARYRGKKRGWTLKNGDPLPDHAPKYISPGWRDVQVALDPNADTLVVAKDSKGRGQRIYSQNHKMRAAAEKFARTNELRQKIMKIEQEIEKDTKSKDPAIREASACLRLINETGIRPGSSRDTRAEKQAYGATTLEGRHVKVLKDGVHLRFVGKKGVDLDIPVTNGKIASDLIRRAKSAGRRGKLFDTTQNRVLAYSKSKDGGGFKTKDFRTARGTTVAIKTMRGMRKPKTEQEYKEAVKQVATAVSKKLGNTPTVALQSYIDPTVFGKWRVEGE